MPETAKASFNDLFVHGEKFEFNGVDYRDKNEIAEIDALQELQRSIKESADADPYALRDINFDI